MQFALSVCGLLHELPSQEPGPTIRHQLAKSSTGMAFNYRASCRSRSHAEFTPPRLAWWPRKRTKLRDGLNLSGMRAFWSSRKTEHFISEATELTTIFSASVKTARAKERVGDGRKLD